MKKMVAANAMLVVKGALIGGCMIVPGMSAGTVMILCGLYGVLIGHISGFYKSKQQFLDAIKFVIPLAIGAIIGILALSHGLEFLIEKFALPVFALFAGLVLGSVPLVIESTYKKPVIARNEAIPNGPPFKVWHLIPAIIACALVICFAVFSAPETEVKDLSVTTGIMFIVAGAITTAAMLIPGISGAFLLILIGYYNTVLDAVNTFNIPILALFVLGAPIGLFVAAKGIGFFLRRFKIMSYMAIVGFLVGSVVGIFLYPGTYDSATNALGIVAAAILFVIGFALVVMLSKFQKNKEEIFKI